LWLAILGVSRRGQGLFWAVLVGLALLLAIGSPLTRLLYFYLPGYSATGSPARVLCLWAFGLAVLTGLGFERRERWGLGLAIWAAGFLVALGLAWSLLPQGVSRTPLLQGVLTSLPMTLSVMALAIGALVAQQRGILSPPLATSMLVALAVLPPSAHGYRYPLYAEREEVFPPAPILEEARPAAGERIAVLNMRWSLYEAPPAALPPNTATAYRIPDAGGYDSLIPRYTKQMLDIINGEDSAPPENGNMQFVKRLTPRLRWMRVARVLTPDGWQPVPDGETPAQGVYLGRAELAPDTQDPATLAQILERAWAENRVLLYGDGADEALERYGAGVPVGAAQVEWLEVRATRVRLQVNNPASQTAWLMVSDTWYPRWRAQVDGKPVPLLRANLAFRALPVPPGAHEITMTCYGTDLLIGFLVTLGVAVGLVALGKLPARSA